MSLTHTTMRNLYVIEELLMFIQTKIDEHEYQLTELHAQYEGGDLYSNDDSVMIDYHEGAVEALSIILNKAKELYNG